MGRTDHCRNSGGMVSKLYFKSCSRLCRWAICLCLLSFEHSHVCGAKPTAVQACRDSIAAQKTAEVRLYAVVRFGREDKPGTI